METNLFQEGEKIIMNDYCILTHGFKDNNILNAIENKMIDDSFKCIKWDNNLYSVYRIEDIDKLNEKVNLNRIKIIAPDGPANYMRNTLNKMSDKEFDKFIEYVLSISDRKDMIGSSAHTIDILKK